jgi:hypothetical protein
MGLYIDDQAMTKKAALEFLKISPTFIPQVRRKIIQVVTRQIDKDKVRPPKSIGGKPYYLIYVPHLEKEVSVRYATSQRKDKDQNFVYPHPKTLALHPAEDGTMLIPDELEFLFWFLRPMCEQSPFRDKSKQYFYGFKDDHAKATADMEREEKYIMAISILVGPSAWTDVQLKHLAKGMNIMGVDDMSPMVVKNELKKLAYKDPVVFYNNANSREVLFSGKIQEAIDAKVIQLMSLNGMQRWYLGSEEILPIAYGQNALTELKNHMAEKWYLYADKINDALQGVDLASKLNNPLNDAAFETVKLPTTAKIRAELTPEEVEVLKEIKAKDWLLEKMHKIDGYDKSNLDKMHPAQRESYLANKDKYEIWKRAQELESEAQ